MYGDCNVDVVNQNPTVHVMSLKSKDIRQSKRQIKLKEFYEYQLAYTTKEDRLAMSENVDFCVNVDIGTWELQMKEIVEKVPPELMCSTQYDMLYYSRVRVLGVNEP